MVLNKGNNNGTNPHHIVNCILKKHEELMSTNLKSILAGINLT